MGKVLRENTVGDLVRSKKRLLEVPYTATAEDVVSALLTHNILAMPVAAPPGEWIGAGGSSVIVNDPKTGAPRKQYIGIVSVLDVLMQVAQGTADDPWSLQTPVSTLIGHSLEGLSLWVLSPETLVFDALEPYGKGVHRALVPAEDNHAATAEGVLLSEAAPYYHFCSQTDVIRFLHHHAAELAGLTDKTVQEIGAYRNEVLAIPSNLTMADALKCMRTANLTAVPIVEPDSSLPDSEPVLVQGRGRAVVATLSASDLRGCTTEVLAVLPKLNVLDFLRRVILARHFGFGSAFSDTATNDPSFSGSGLLDEHGEVKLRPAVTCSKDTPTDQVMATALENSVHRVWVTNQEGLLDGVVTFTDIIKAIWDHMKQEEEPRIEKSAGS